MSPEVVEARRQKRMAAQKLERQKTKQLEKERKNEAHKQILSDLQSSGVMRKFDNAAHDIRVAEEVAQTARKAYLESTAPLPGQTRTQRVTWQKQRR